jgi:TonB family protein
MAAHAEAYVRTEEAESELRAPRLGLSLSQRKLLSLIDASQSVAGIAASLHSDEARVRRDLARLTELGLVRPAHATSPRAAPAQPLTSRLSEVVPVTRLGPRRRGLAIGIVAVTGIAGMALVAWRLHDRTPGDGTTPTEPAPMARAAESTQAVPQPAPITAAADATRGTIRVATPAPDAAIAASPVPERASPPAVPLREEAKHSPAAQPVRIATAPLPTTQPAAAQPITTQPITTQPAATQPGTTQPATQARTPEAVRSERPAVPAAALVAAPPPAAATTPPIPAMPQLPVAARPAEDRANASVAERAPVIPPVANPGASADARPSTRAPAAPVDAQPATVIANAPATALAPPPRPHLVPIAREEPAFPRDALLANVTSGRVRARLTIDKDGRVSNVQIVSAEPRRVFDRAVDRALSRWRFETSSESARTTEVVVDFKAD